MFAFHCKPRSAPGHIGYPVKDCQAGKGLFTNDLGLWYYNTIRDNSIALVPPRGLRHERGDSQPPTDSFLRHLLSAVLRIALIGASPNPSRPSHGVMAFLLARGYGILPVNPRAEVHAILGQPLYQALDDVPPPVHMVDVFRRPEAAGKVVDDAILLKDAEGILGVWMQIGVRDEAAALRARRVGIWVVMDRCPRIEHVRLMAADRS